MSFSSVAPSRATCLATGVLALLLPALLGAQARQTEQLTPVPGNRLVRDLVEAPVRMCAPGSSNDTVGIGAVPRDARILNGRLMFTSFVNGGSRVEILSTDGTFDGTELIANTCFQDCAEPIHLGTIDGAALYGRSEGQTRPERATALWWTDGNDEATTSASLPAGFDYVRGLGSDNQRVWITSRPTTGTPFPFVELKPESPPLEIGEAESTLLFGTGIPFGSGIAVGSHVGGLHFLEGSQASTLESSCFADQLLQQTEHGLLMLGTCISPESIHTFGIFELELTGARLLLELPTPLPIGVPLPPTFYTYRLNGNAYVSNFSSGPATLYRWSDDLGDLEVIAEGPQFEPAYVDDDMLLATLYHPSDPLPYSLWRLDGPEPVNLALSEIRPFGFGKVGDVVAFYAQDEFYGGELWRTDGTQDRTFVAFDTAVGSAGFQDSPYLQCRSHDFMTPTELNGEVYYAGYQPDYGLELYALPLFYFQEGGTPEPEPCSRTDVLCLHQERFEVSLNWQTATESGAAEVVDFKTDDSGLFWFFGASNWEVMVKVLDGCGVNGHYWVLAAGTTDVAYQLEVFDTQTNQVWRADNPLDRASPAMIDITAFEGCTP